MGLKTADTTCVSMCARHHDEWTNHRGWCRGWRKDVRRAWFRAATQVTLGELERRQRQRIAELPVIPF